MPREIVRRRLLVHGRVQGVFFRDSIRERARREGVFGWARNRDDGTVEVVLEGDETAVTSVAAFCETGPPAGVGAWRRDTRRSASGLARLRDPLAAA